MLVGTALVGSGIEWPKMTIRGTNTHVFAVGDWGGLAGTLPHNSQIIQYKGGDQGLWWLEWFTEFTVCSNNFFGGRNMCQSQGIWKTSKILGSDDPTSIEFQEALDMGNNHTNTRYTAIDSIQWFFSNAPRGDEDPWQVDKRWVPTPWGDIERMPKPMICLVPPLHLGLGKVKFFL